jgi:hypothetical protein
LQVVPLLLQPVEADHTDGDDETHIRVVTNHRRLLVQEVEAELGIWQVVLWQLVRLRLVCMNIGRGRRRRRRRQSVSANEDGMRKRHQRIITETTRITMMITTPHLLLTHLADPTFLTVINSSLLQLPALVGSLITETPQPLI